MTSARPAAPLIFLRTWLLPLAVGAAAFSVHYALHVPAGPLPPPSPAEIEAEKKAADQEKKEEETREREADRKAGKLRPQSTVRELAYEPFKRPRPAHIIEQLWAYYEPTPLKREPTFEAWQSAHKPLLWQIVSAARHTAMPDAPAIDVSASACHTIRCRFTISAPAPEPLDTMIAVLKQLQLGDGPLWHSLEASAPAADPTKKTSAADKAGTAAPSPRFKAELTVSFMRDLPTLPEISLPGQGRLRTQSPTSGPIPAGQLPTTGPTTTTSTRAPSTTARPKSTPSG